MSAPLRRYLAHGLRIHARIALPFAPAAAPFDGEPDATVRVGGVPQRLARPAARAGDAWQAAPGACLLNAGAGRCLVADGREIAVDPSGDDRRLGLFLAGSAFAALLQQRGVATLRAAAVATESGALLLAGDPGIGKSSLAAALVERGCALLSDGFTSVVPDADGRLAALPGLPALQLWGNALEALGWPRPAHAQVREELDKHLLPAARFHAAPLAVRAVYVLMGVGTEAALAIEPLPRSAAFRLLNQHTYRRQFLAPMGQTLPHYRAIAALAQSVPLRRVRLIDDPFRLNALADRIRADALPPASFAGRCDLARGASAAPKRRVGARSPKPPPKAGEATPASIVWLASYPKSGSTWLRAVLTNYLQDGQQPASINALVGVSVAIWRTAFDETLAVDSSNMTWDEVMRWRPQFHEALARKGSKPLFIKSHEACLRLPAGAPLFHRAAAAGAIYLFRNPLDVAVSYAHHRQCSIDATIAWMSRQTAAEGPPANGINPQFSELLLTWSDHVAGWLEQRELPLLAVRYEDMLARPMATFGAALRFAGLDVRAARLARAIDRAAFARLRAQERQHGFVERQPTAPSFFRAGVAGAWRNVLTARQVQAVVDAHAPVMGRLGYLEEAQAFLAGGS